MSAPAAAARVETGSVGNETSTPADDTLDNPLWTALERVDILLAWAVRHRRSEETAPDRTLQLLAQTPGGLGLNGHLDLAGSGAGLTEPVAGARPLADLAIGYGLDPFELDVLLLALAPDLDPRYGELFGHLEGRASGRPSLDLVLELLCSSPNDRHRRIAHFLPDATLVTSGAIQLIAADPTLPLLAHQLHPDPQAVRVALSAGGLDGRLIGWCTLAIDDAPAQPPMSAELLQRLAEVVDGAVEADQPCRLYLHGSPGTGAQAAARWLAARADLPLFSADITRLPSGTDLTPLLELALREARLWGRALLIEGFDRGSAVEPEREASVDPGWHQRFLTSLRQQPGLVILTGSAPLPVGSAGAGVLAMDVPMPDSTVRRRVWRDALGGAGVRLPEEALDAVAARFRLVPDQIVDAAASAVLASGGFPTSADLFAAARASSRTELARLSRLIEPAHSWTDLVLPEDAIAQLRELCDRVTQRDRVLDDWGFGRSMSRGRGTSALFTGPSGTGKTMAAEIVAGELGLELYAIDLATVVSKYIGETEKNLGRLFDAAERANAVLFFDEADALFGKRSEVRDSHDRYANVEVSYLLQRLEEYEGVAILASNLPHHLDDAFVRRLSATITFPFPEEDVRRELWGRVWPASVPLAADIDLERLASSFRLSGGNIRNVSLQAAYRAATHNRPVTMSDVLHGTRREYQKLGKALRPDEIELPKG
jgi:hypothetical protein